WPREPSVSWTLNAYWPACVGVPDITPFEPSVSPSGSAPEPATNDHVAPLLAPDEANVKLYAVPTVPSGVSFVEIATPPTILIVNSRCAFEGRHQAADGGSSSLSSTQNEDSPAEVGVPCTRPLLSSTRPDGSAPFKMLN